MKNIALLVPNLRSGGSERIVSRLSKLLEEKYNIFTVLFDDKNISYEYGGKLICLNAAAKTTRLGKLYNFFKRVVLLRKFIRKEKIDIVFSFTSAADRVNAFCGAKCKRIVSCRGANSLEKKMGFYKKMCDSSSGILFNSKGMREIYLEKYPEDEDKAFALHNVFDIENIKEKSEEPLENEVKEFFETYSVVTTVSRFVFEKGHWNLLKAFEILKESVPNAGLVLVGHMGQYEEDIKKMAKESRYYKDILFVGYSDNPFKYMANSKVYAMCSLKEGFPNALVEAMASGVPVVSTNCRTGPREILFKNCPEDLSDVDYTKADYGIITPPFDTEIDFNIKNANKKHKIFADAIATIIENPVLSESYQKKGDFRAKEFDGNTILGEYINLIENL